MRRPSTCARARNETKKGLCCVVAVHFRTEFESCTVFENGTGSYGQLQTKTNTARKRRFFETRGGGRKHEGVDDGKTQRTKVDQHRANAGALEPGGLPSQQSAPSANGNGRTKTAASTASRG